MAHIEELQAQSDTRWRAQDTARRLDGEIQQLKVAMTELDSVRPKKATYIKKANVFFLAKRDVIVKAKRNELQDKEKTRRELGLQLRTAA